MLTEEMRSVEIPGLLARAFMGLSPASPDGRSSIVIVEESQYTIKRYDTAQQDSPPVIYIQRPGTEPCKWSPCENVDDAWMLTRINTKLQLRVQDGSLRSSPIWSDSSALLSEKICVEALYVLVAQESMHADEARELLKACEIEPEPQFIVICLDAENRYTQASRRRFDATQAKEYIRGVAPERKPLRVLVPGIPTNEHGYPMRPQFGTPTPAGIEERLKYIRGEIEAERVSYGEIAELQELAEDIPEDDLLLLEWAGR